MTTASRATTGGRFHRSVRRTGVMSAPCRLCLRTNPRASSTASVHWNKPVRVDYLDDVIWGASTSPSQPPRGIPGQLGDYAKSAQIAGREHVPWLPVKKSLRPRMPHGATPSAGADHGGRPKGKLPGAFGCVCAHPCGISDGCSSRQVA
ncbi:hypothetical protein FRAHR75_1000011 [Frankia sp. Hr75.2]|nr:hypothetical protein FRAHR75_1000011 [Frankia sp. Hr75.2]